MTTITARGWPGLERYKSPEGRGDADRVPAASLRSYDLWLVPYFKDGKGDRPQGGPGLWYYLQERLRLHVELLADQ